MPLYEYECQQCHKRTEKIQKFSDPQLTVCPYCGGPLERTITAPAVQFAGGGWYKDLYSSAKPPAAGNAASSAEAGTKSTEGATSGDGGSKPAESGGPAAAKPAATAPAPAATPAKS